MDNVKQYEAPEIRRVGTFADLTQQGRGRARGRGRGRGRDSDGGRS